MEELTLAFLMESTKDPCGTVPAFFCRLPLKTRYFQITGETSQNSSFVVYSFYFLPVKAKLTFK